MNRTSARLGPFDPRTSGALILGRLARSGHPHLIVPCTQRFQQDFYVTLGTTATRDLWKGWEMGGTIGLPFLLIVKPSTMKVLDNVQGYDPQQHAAAVALCK